MKKTYSAPAAQLIAFAVEEAILASVNPILPDADNESTKDPATDFGNVSLW